MIMQYTVSEPKEVRGGQRKRRFVVATFAEMSSLLEYLVAREDEIRDLTVNILNDDNTMVSVPARQFNEITLRNDLINRGLTRTIFSGFTFDGSTVQYVANSDIESFNIPENVTFTLVTHRIDLDDNNNPIVGYCGHRVVNQEGLDRALASEQALDIQAIGGVESLEDAG